MPPTVSTMYSFGPFHLDPDSELLFHSSEPLPLGQRAVGLLRVLVDQAGVPVSKRALIDAVWGVRAVEESNLTVQIAAARRALAQGGGERWIETWPRRGYRFSGPAVIRPSRYNRDQGCEGVTAPGDVARVDEPHVALMVGRLSDIP